MLNKERVTEQVLHIIGKERRTTMVGKILIAVITFIITSVISLLCKWVKKQIDRYFEEKRKSTQEFTDALVGLSKALDKNNNGTKVAMKSALLGKYDLFNKKWLNGENITGEEYLHWCDDYKAYSELGGNGEIQVLNSIVEEKYRTFLFNSEKDKTQNTK